MIQIKRLYVGEYEDADKWLYSAVLKNTKPDDYFLIFKTGKFEDPPSVTQRIIGELAQYKKIIDAVELGEDDYFRYVQSKIESIASENTYIIFVGNNIKPIYDRLDKESIKCANILFFRTSKVSNRRLVPKNKTSNVQAENGDIFTGVMETISVNPDIEDRRNDREYKKDNKRVSDSVKKEENVENSGHTSEKIKTELQSLENKRLDDDLKKAELNSSKSNEKNDLIESGNIIEIDDFIDNSDESFVYDTGIEEPKTSEIDPSLYMQDTSDVGDVDEINIDIPEDAIVNENLKSNKAFGNKSETKENEEKQRSDEKEDKGNSSDKNNDEDEEFLKSVLKSAIDSESKHKEKSNTDDNEQRENIDKKSPNIKQEARDNRKKNDKSSSDYKRKFTGKDIKKQEDSQNNAGNKEEKKSLRDLERVVFGKVYNGQTIDEGVSEMDEKKVDLLDMIFGRLVDHVKILVPDIKKLIESGAFQESDFYEFTELIVRSRNCEDFIRSWKLGNPSLAFNMRTECYDEILLECKHYCDVCTKLFVDDDVYN